MHVKCPWYSSIQAYWLYYVDKAFRAQAHYKHVAISKVFINTLCGMLHLHKVSTAFVEEDLLIEGQTMAPSELGDWNSKGSC